MIRCTSPGWEPRAELRRRRARSLSSFTLIELIVAIAVAAFMIISILGLMAYAMQLVHQSDNYSHLTNVASQVLTTISSAPITWGPTANGSRRGGAATITNYYTFEGMPTNSSSSGAAYYQVLISDSVPTGTGYPEPNTSSYSIYMMEPVRVVIRWPAPLYRSTNVIVTSLCNYE